MSGEPVFDITGTGIGPYPIREFTSDTGAYTIRYVPRDGVIIWTDRDYGPAASRVLEWLCAACRKIHPRQEGDRLTRPCPRCGEAMIPTSPSVRALENLRAEVEGLRRRVAGTVLVSREDLALVHDYARQFDVDDDPAMVRVAEVLRVSEQPTGSSPPAAD